MTIHRDSPEVLGLAVAVREYGPWAGGEDYDYEVEWDEGVRVSPEITEEQAEEITLLAEDASTCGPAAVCALCEDETGQTIVENDEGVPSYRFRPFYVYAHGRGRDDLRVVHESCAENAGWVG